MLRNLLLCGLIAGLCAGLLATGFAATVGERPVDDAIAFEDSHAAAGGGSAPAPAVVSRELQKSLGLVTAATVYGIAVGGLFALTFAVVYGRVGRASPGATALWLAAAAFVVLFLVPFVKYPANPPAVGAAETIGDRTALYFTMMWISVFAAVAAARVRRALAERLSRSGATGVAVAAYLVVVVVAGLALPSVDEVPQGFPATALWEFRQATIGTQLVMWATIGTVFAAAAQRAMTEQPLWPWGAAARARRGARG